MQAKIFPLTSVDDRKQSFYSPHIGLIKDQLFT